ncbi:MAG: SRPBCC family protein, partial [Pirellula sp.]
MPSWNVARSIEIAAPVSKVYDLISDFNTWTSWSPWLIADPK